MREPHDAFVKGALDVVQTAERLLMLSGRDKRMLVSRGRSIAKDKQEDARGKQI